MVSVFFKSGNFEGSTEIPEISMERVARAFEHVMRKEMTKRKEIALGEITRLIFKGKGSGTHRGHRWVLTERLLKDAKLSNKFHLSARGVG